MRNLFSRLKKKLKHTLRGSRHIPDRAGSDAIGERVDPSCSPPRPEPHVVAGGGHNRGANGANAGGRQARSTGRSQPESVLADESDDRRGREADVNEREANPKYPPLDLDVKAVVGSGCGGKVERLHSSPSTPSIPQSRTPESA